MAKPTPHVSPMVLVERIAPEGAANACDLKSGDGLLSVNTAAVAGHAQATSLLVAAVGQIDLEIVRDGKVMSVSVEKETQETKLGIILSGAKFRRDGACASFT